MLPLQEPGHFCPPIFFPETNGKDNNLLFFCNGEKTLGLAKNIFGLVRKPEII